MNGTVKQGEYCCLALLLVEVWLSENTTTLHAINRYQGGRNFETFPQQTDESAIFLVAQPILAEPINFFIAKI